MNSMDPLAVFEIRPHDGGGKTAWLHRRGCTETDARSQIFEANRASTMMKLDLQKIELGVCKACHGQTS